MKEGLKMTRLNLIISVMGLNLVIFLSSCAQRQVKTNDPLPTTDAVKTLQVESTIQVYNKKNKSSSSVRAQIAVERPSRLRVDVIGPLSVPIAQLVLRDDRFGVNLFRERKSFTGSPQTASVQKAIPVAMRPHDLISFIFKETPKDWKCGEVAVLEGRVCVDPTRQMRWSALSPKTGDHGFRLETAQLQIDFDNKTLSRNQDLNPQLFEFRQPAGFKTHSLED
jgi:outer membrane lipoprotein-sorting protein